MANKRRSGKAANPRREQVANACNHCRTSKVKCSGKHPACSRCVTKKLECQYDVSEEGMTKRQHFQHEMSEQKKELDRAMSVLNVLQHGSDHEAAATLARLRMGNSIEYKSDRIQQRRPPQHVHGPNSCQYLASSPPSSVAGPIDPEIERKMGYSNANYFDPMTTNNPPISPRTPGIVCNAPQTQWQAPMASMSSWSYPLSPTSDRPTAMNCSPADLHSPQGAFPFDQTFQQVQPCSAPLYSDYADTY